MLFYGFILKWINKLLIDTFDILISRINSNHFCWNFSIHSALVLTNYSVIKIIRSRENLMFELLQSNLKLLFAQENDFKSGSEIPQSWINTEFLQNCEYKNHPRMKFYHFQFGQATNFWEVNWVLEWIKAKYFCSF